MEIIFHEKQEGSLCAQHCLNSLLQGAYFTPVDLSTLALNLDEAERLRMAECGEESDEYRRFLAQPSGNMDDSGYFSVQVISSALQVWNLELVPYSSTDQRVKHVFTNPCQMNAFICNYKDHWFTIRKLGQQWFNLNSLLDKPQLISDTYLSCFLAQLKNEGYSIFVVFGTLPDCEADRVLKSAPIVASALQQPRDQTQRLPSTSSYDDDPDMQAALQLSLNEVDTRDTSANLNKSKNLNSSDADLQKAIQMSLEAGTFDVDVGVDIDEDEAALKKAIHMSLEC